MRNPAWLWRPALAANRNRLCLRTQDILSRRSSLRRIICLTRYMETTVPHVRLCGCSHLTGHLAKLVHASIYFARTRELTCVRGAHVEPPRECSEILDILTMSCLATAHLVSEISISAISWSQAPKEREHHSSSTLSIDFTYDYDAVRTVNHRQ